MPRGNADSGFSGPLSAIAVGGIAMGVLVMVMAISILSGFQKDITTKVSGFGNHLTITAYTPSQTYTEEPVTVDSTLLEGIARVNGVKHIQAFATKGGMIKTDSQIYGIMFRGYGNDWDKSFFKNCLIDGELTIDDNQVIISSLIANKLSLSIGDKMRTYFWQEDNYRPRVFTVAGIYNTDLENMDQTYVIGNRRIVQRLNDWDTNQVGGYEVAIDDFKNLETVASEITPLLSYEMMLTTITQANPALFSWLDLLNTNTTLLLLIMAIVSAVCIISALLIMIYEKSSTIGLLRALGATGHSVGRIFLIRAIWIALEGIIIGDTISIAISLIQNKWHILTLDPESYSMSNVPVFIDPSVYILVSIGTFLLCMLAITIPVSSISKITPAKTMRVEK